MTDATCQWHDEDEDDGGRITAGPVCGEPALFLSCMPMLRTPTCAKHTCRCGKPLTAPPAAPAPWTPARRERAGRAAWAARLAEFAGRHPHAFDLSWEHLGDELRASYMALGEAAARADEEGD